MMRPRSAAKPAQAIINLIMSSLYSPCRPYGQRAASTGQYSCSHGSPP